MSYKSYDELFAAIKDSYANACSATISIGDELYQRAAGLASALWGLYREVEWSRDQIWPDTSSQDNLVRHASQYGEILKGADYAGLLSRLQARLRSPAAGGNKVDYEGWCLAFSSLGESIDKATCYPAGFGPGTVVMLVQNRDGSSPSAAFLSALKAHLLDVGPVVPAAVYVFAPSTLDVAVQITMQGGDVVEAARLIRAYMDSISAGTPVHPQAWVSFCYQAGAVGASLISPPSTALIPSVFQRVSISSLQISAG